MAVGFKHRRNPHSRKGGSAVEKHLTPSLRYLIPGSSLIYMPTPVRSVVQRERVYTKGEINITVISDPLCGTHTEEEEEIFDVLVIL